LGAGTKVITYSALLGAEVNITHIVDGGPKKSGGYIANINVSIELLSDTSFADADIVLLSATSYLDEIINRLKMEFSLRRGSSTLVSAEQFWHKIWQSNFMRIM